MKVLLSADRLSLLGGCILLFVIVYERRANEQLNGVIHTNHDINYITVGTYGDNFRFQYL